MDYVNLGNRRSAFSDTCGNSRFCFFGRFAEAVEVTAVQRGCERCEAVRSGRRPLTPNGCLARTRI